METRLPEPRETARVAEVRKRRAEWTRVIVSPGCFAMGEPCPRCGAVLADDELCAACNWNLELDVDCQFDDWDKSVAWAQVLAEETRDAHP